ncbi:MAG: hypothetical protein H7833_08810 [Magnetococcus sp. DMHC-1]
MPAKPSLLSNQRVEKRSRSKPLMKSTSERIFIQLPKLPSFRRTTERAPIRSIAAPVSATIRRAGGSTVNGATSLFTSLFGILMALFLSTGRALQWSFIVLGRTLQWSLLTIGRILQWSFYATSRALQWTFHALRISWQWSVFILTSAFLLLRQGITFVLEWLQIAAEWTLYLLSEMMILLKRGVWHLMEATKQIAWFVTDVIQQSFFFVADVVQQIVWTLSDWIRGAVTFSKPDADLETEEGYADNTHAAESLDGNPSESIPYLEPPLFAKNKKEWEDDTHFEFAKMNSLDNEEQTIPQEALEDQAGALRMRLSTDPYHP